MPRNQFPASLIILVISILSVISLLSLFYSDDKEIRDLKSSSNDQIIQSITNFINNKDEAKISKLICNGEASTSTPEVIAKEIVKFRESSKINSRQSPSDKNIYFFYPEGRSYTDYIDINKITIARESLNSPACILIPYG